VTIYAYLASGFRQRSKFRELAKELSKLKIETCSSWIWVKDRPGRSTKDWDFFADKIASKNIIDLTLADILIVDTEGIAQSNHGGTHFETGFMFARHKPVFIVGERGNTFHWLLTPPFKDYEELLLELKSRYGK